MRLLPFFLFLAASVLSLAAAAPAGAAPTWLTPVGVAGPLPDTTRGDIAVAPDGTALAVSQQRVGTADHIRARLRRPGGAFGPSIELATANGALPSVAVDQRGNFTAVWTVGAQLKAARLAAGASAFEATETVGTVDPVNPQPVLAVGGNGTAVIAVREAATVRAALRTGAAGQFGPISGALSGTLAIGDTFDAAVDDSGHAIIVWSRDDTTATGKIFVEASERAAGVPSFGAVRPLSQNPAGGDHATGPVVAMAPNGRTIVLWTFDTAATQPRVQDIERKPNGVWISAPEFASRAVDTAGSPQVAMAGDGTAIAVWGVEVATVFLPQAAVRRPDQTFQVLQPNLSSAQFGALDISVNRAGTATVAWSGSMSEVITARRRPPGGAFGNADTIAVGTQGSANPAIAVNVQSLETDNQGNSTLLYQRDVVGTGVNSHSLLASSFDAAAPSLASVAVPTTGTPGAAVGMAAAASDRLAVPVIRWSFGDGTSATGPAVSHAYRAAGAYSVTVSATDAAGNTTSASRSIVISPIGPPPPPPEIESPISLSWGVAGRKLYILRLRVTEVPRGGKVQLRCRGRKCPFRRKSSTRRRRGTITLYRNISTSRVVGKRNRTFRAGQRLQIRITAPGFVGKVVKYRLRRGKIPTGSRPLCLPIGSTTPVRC